MIHIDMLQWCEIAQSYQGKPRPTVCRFCPADFQTPPQQPLRDTRRYPALDLREQDSPFDEHDGTHRECRRAPLRPHLPLHLLQVCRQIYGEAALIPFTKNSFACQIKIKGSPLRALLATLVPAQVRAIAQLIMTVGRCYGWWTPRYLGVLELKGLRSFHLVLPENFHLHDGPITTRILRFSLDGHELGSLSQLDLRSMEMSFMFTGEENKTIKSSEVDEVGRLAEFFKTEIFEPPGVHLARRKAQQEGWYRNYDARRATTRWQILRNRR
jgi:hypothetical protein